MTGSSGNDDERTVFEPTSDGTSAPGEPPQASTPGPQPPVSQPALEEKTTFEPAPRKKEPAGQFAVGDVLNDIYRITRFIARGGMGEVYEACNIHPPEERVAVKVMLQHLAQDELVAAMFAKEAAMLVRLHHEAIVQYRFATRDPRGRPFIVTEFVDGPSLEDRLGKLKLTDEQFGALAQKLAAGLGTAHTFGAIHRDIAPDNILLADGDPLRPKIIDFGIAKDAREQSGTIVGDGFAGKLKYVAPEQLGEFDRNVGAWSDIYSLALTLRALAAGKHSDMGGSLADAIRKRQSVPDLAMIPTPFRYAFERALQPDPADRPQSMAEFNLLLTEPVERTGLATFGTLEEAPTTVEGTGSGETLLARIKAQIGSIAAAATRTLPGSMGQKNVALWAGGGLAAVALLVTVVVVATSSGDGGETSGTAASSAIDGEPSGQAAPGLDMSSPAFATLAQRAVRDIDCAWLAFDGPQGGAAHFSGGAGNPAAAMSAVESGLGAGGAASVSIDVGDVVRFDPKSCAIINALRQVRSPKPLLTTPQPLYEAEPQPEPMAGDETVYAKVLINAANLEPGSEVALAFVREDGIGNILTSNRAETVEYVRRLSGDVSSDGFVLPLPVGMPPGENESFGILILRSDGKLPATVGQRGPLDETWPTRFLEGAKANGWTADIAWFAVENSLPD